MILKRIEFDLSEQSINELIKEIRLLKNDFKKMSSYITDESTDALRIYAQKNVSKTVGKTGYVPTGELEESFIKQKISENSYSLINTHPNSAAVEFGTGISGSKSAHPIAGEVSYQYNVNNHEKAWLYYDENGNSYKTVGQIPHRFMYDAILEFKKSGDLQKIGKKAFEKSFGK